MDRARRLKTIGASLGIGAAMCLALCGIGGLFAAAFGMRSATPAGAIEEVLALDAEAGGSSGDHRVVVEDMRKIDLERCPQDFQEAYVDHIDAWQLSAETREEAQAWIDQHLPGQLTPDDVLYTTNVPPNLSPDAESHRRAVVAMGASTQQAIQSTYDRLLRAAQKHGARTLVDPRGPLPD